MFELALFGIFFTFYIPYEIIRALWKMWTNYTDEQRWQQVQADWDRHLAEQRGQFTLDIPELGTSPRALRLRR